MAVSAVARATHSLRRVLFPDLETLIPPERLLFRFDRPESLAAWQCATDRDVGGKTDARLTHLEDFARFEGALSKEKTGNMKDSGYAMIRSRPKRRQFNKNFFTSPLFNLSDYDGLLLNLRGDGRMYFLNIQCDGLMPDDLFQTFLPTKAGVWETVAVPFHDFLLTFRGSLQMDQPLLNRRRIRTIGLALFDDQTRPFQLDIREIHAITEGGLVRRNLSWLQGPGTDVPPPGTVPDRW